ncbi:hypothetical protein VTK73DRAFT_429 [Phialemonium thermophilum]|uniref:Zn(2)-C6 fungal-type domain-containing protein n=1 Tax=Phialemonium thermophilum TaxID=223376 RepID=A0ABR3VV64_9PEZI
METTQTNTEKAASDNPAAVAPVRPRRVRRYPRSKLGCLTCKQRKVKCDESQPICSHCVRLNIPCRWRPVPPRQGSLPSSSGEKTPTTRTPASSVPSGPSRTPTFGFGPSHPQEPSIDVFDYASFIWSGQDVWPPATLDVGSGFSFDTHSLETEYDSQNQHQIQARAASHNASLSSSLSNHASVGQNGVLAARQTSFVAQTQAGAAPSFRGDELGHEPSEPSTLSEMSPEESQVVAAQESGENHNLIHYFIHAVTPPIISEVEAHKNWISMRKILVKMAGDSRMVRWAVLAFASVMLRHRDRESAPPTHQDHYADAAAEVALQHQEEGAPSWVEHSAQREKLLAALFFLSYVDILESRTEAAHVHLKRAYGIFQQAQKESFTLVERRLLLWLRLLDARTVPAGGEGLFLSHDNEELLVQISPASCHGGGDDPSRDSGNTFDDADVEDEIFQVLYQPGYIFFQKVQSFTGRIAKIDPWHRSRGTVEDETEVMSKAAAIAADLRTLYEQRPAFLDLAAAGKLTAPHISAHLAFTITRAFRTYLCNYYASKIHLHRVAYKSFPLTQEALDAMDHIRRLSRLVAEGLDPEDPLPVNMLWPLLMLGTEEQDPENRAWIKENILRMEKIAGNARITARVLDEVQARQDATETRVDIGLVMREMFNLRFAVV